jgi:hypothetical protein
MKSRRVRTLADRYLRLGGAKELAASSVERRRMLGAIVENLAEAEY